MLTDIFANRYANVPIWSSFGEPERRLLVQGFRILTEHVCPYWKDGRAHEYGKSFWADLHRRNLYGTRTPLAISASLFIHDDLGGQAAYRESTVDHGQSM